MKKKIIASLIVFVAICTTQAQEITFAENKIEWGTIQEKNGDKSHDFQFTNTGNKPLLIKTVIASCGCTSTEWLKKEYQPGEKGIIRLTYHPKGRKETSINLVAEVYTNKVSKGTTNLEITGNVQHDTSPSPAYFNPSLGRKSQASAEASLNEFEQILERTRMEIYEKETPRQTDLATEKLLTAMLPEGKWNDVDYACFFRTNWEPVDHLKRLVTIATSYTDKRSAYYGNEVLYNAINTALQYWIQQDPKCHNWWYNQISVPQTQASLLALMDAGLQKLPADVSGSLLKTMSERSDPRKWTGANKMDIAIHHLIRGCLLKNDSIVQVNANEIFYPVKIVESEGIQEDMSYHQHGSQLYIGGYGTVFIDNIVRMGNILNGTKFAMSDEKLNLFSDFTRNTYLNVFRGRHLDFSVTGRGVSRKGLLDYGACASLFKSLIALDAKHADEYAKTAHRFYTQNASYQRCSRNAMYYRSDYMLHQRKNYDFSIRTASTRTQKTESGNGENLYGTYMSDGATNIRVNGNEYTDIFPVWEWDKIPGTTTPAGEKRNLADWGTKGTSTFTGGVSDGQYGVMTFDLNDYGVKARKSWFMFDDEAVCLGAGIHSELPENIITTLNQCHLDGDVWSHTGKMLQKVRKEYSAFDHTPQWIWHDSIGYFFPQESKLILKTGEQKGNWAKINFNYPATEISLPVFNLTIDHGKSPQNATYAYIVVPGVNHPNELKNYSAKEIKIEQNNTDIQAVSNTKLGISQIVFFSAGTFDNGKINVKALKPCIVQIKQKKGKIKEVLIANPKNKEKLKQGVDVIVTP